MAVVSRKGKKGTTYQVKVRDSVGSWFPVQSFQRKVDAEAYERSLLSRRDVGQLAPNALQKQLTISDYWKRWSAECRHRVSDGWKMSQDQMYRDYISPVLGPCKLVDVRPQHIGSLLAGVQGKGLAAETVRHVYNILHKMFEDAVEHYEFLNRNPALKRYRPKVPRKERPYLPPADTWKLLHHARSHWAGPAVWVMGLTALRPGEAQALRVRALDFANDRIRIEATFDRKMRRVQDHPKQKDSGSAPMPQVLKDYLAAQVKEKSPDDFVCPNFLGGMLCYESFCRVLRRLCREAEVRELTPHELRHSCTELWVNEGASAEDIRRLLNQKSLTATQRYIHRTDERLNRIAGQIGSPKPTHPSPSPTKRPALRVVSS